MNPISEVTEGRRLVTAADKAYVGGGVLSGLILDLLGVTRLRGGKRPSRKEIGWMAKFRGHDEGDARDAVVALRRWRA